VQAFADGTEARVSQISIASIDEGEVRAKHSLVVNADGNISGYVAEADGTTSTFGILADTFKVANGTTSLPVFTVDTINQIIYAAADIKSSNYSWNAGVPIGFGLFRNGDLDSGSAYNFVGGSYYGSTFIGSTSISSNYDWNTGSPIGFGLFAEGDSDSGNNYNIIGGSIYGVTIEAPTLIGTSLEVGSIKVKCPDYPNNYASPIYIDSAHSTTAATTVTATGAIIYSPSYSLGYISDRLVSSITKVNISGILNVNATLEQTRSLSIQVSIDSGAWTTLISGAWRSIFFEHTPNPGNTVQYRVVGWAKDGVGAFISSSVGISITIVNNE